MNDHQDFAQRLAVLSQLVHTRELWVPCCTTSVECLTVPMGETGFVIKFFRGNAECARVDETEDDACDACTECATESLPDVGRDSEARHMAWRLDTPNDADLSSGPLWTCSLTWNRCPGVSIRDALLKYLQMIGQCCDECGIYDPCVSTFKQGVAEKRWCAHCAQAFIAGISVDSSCPICLGEMIRPYESICGHMFHRGCAVAWVASGQNTSCPVCRKSWQLSPEDDAYFAVRPHIPTRQALGVMPRNVALERACA